MNNPIIYALDFDGVICDSAVETGMTGWKVACGLWPDMPDAVPQAIIDRFRAVRPIIETGYEAILAMRLLFLGETVAAIYSGFDEKTPQLLNEAGVTVDELKHRFGATRDQWIARDQAGWVGMNPLFAGVAAKLRNLEQPWYVITTKQERFVKQILEANAVELANERIFGLDRGMSKVEVLKSLMKAHQGATFHFVEDRLPTLLNVLKNIDTASMRLIFALWGYNTDADKAQAKQHPFVLQQLGEFLSP